MSAHAFWIHAVVCSNALLYFQYLGQNVRELASRDAEIMVVAHCTDAEAPRGSSQHAAGLTLAFRMCSPRWASSVPPMTSYLAARDIPALAMVHVKPSSAEARLLRDTNDYHEEFHLRSMPLSAPFNAATESYLGSLRALASEGCERDEDSV